MLPDNLKPGSRVLHINTDDQGEFLGYDSDGSAIVQFDVDPPDYTEHHDPRYLQVEGLGHAVAAAPGEVTL